MSAPFLITGTGRCGTLWLATCLAELGVDVTHSCPWTPLTYQTEKPKVMIKVWDPLKEPELIEHPVMSLLIRNPYDVVRSLAPLIGKAAAVARVLRVNNEAHGRAHMILKAEARVNTLRRVAMWIGLQTELDDIISIVESPKTQNINKSNPPGLDWTLINQFMPEAFEEFEEMAARYGYVLPNG